MQNLDVTTYSQICAGVNNNTVELHSLKVKDKVVKNNEDMDNKNKNTLIATISAHGHRTDVRAVCFSSDNLAFATASGDSVKLWNR